jgi:hypothetical protein
MTIETTAELAHSALGLVAILAVDRQLQNALGNSGDFYKIIFYCN